MAGNVSDAQYGNDLIDIIIGEKNLKLNLDKSLYIIMGSKKARKKIRTDLEKNPLMLNEALMKEVKELKYLGDYLSFDLGDSVQKTVTKRIGIAKHASIEARTVVEDSRSEKLGGINVAFQILEAAILPMLLYNAESWMEIPENNESSRGFPQ